MPDSLLYIRITRGLCAEDIKEMHHNSLPWPDKRLDLIKRSKPQVMKT